MRLQIEKIRSYVLFAIKSGHIIFGVEQIVKAKAVEVILYSSSLSENSKNKLKYYANIKNIVIAEIENQEYMEIINKNNILALAVSDKNLAKAIKDNL